MMSDSILSLLPALTVLGIFLTLSIHLLFATSIYFDALQMERQEKQLYFVGPVAWSLVTLCLGLIAVYIYWIMHHSNLRKPIDPNY